MRARNAGRSVAAAKGVLLPLLIALSLLTTLPASGGGTDGTLEGPGAAEADGGPAAFHGDASGQFIENLGQWDQEVAFVAPCPFGDAVFTEDGVLYDLATSQGGHRVKLSFEGGRPSPPVGEGDLGYPTSYLIGNDSSDWVTGARTFRQLVYRDAWPGVDVRYRFLDGHLKYDLLLDGDADPDLVRFRVDGADGLRTSDDRLDIRVPGAGCISDADLVAWYEDGRPADVSFRVQGDTFGFSVSGDGTGPLVIDPVVMHSSTFLGGTYWEKPIDMVVDGNDDIIVAGHTDSTDFPTTTGAYDTTLDTTDVVVVKMNHNASRVIWATYLGGTRVDWVNALTLDEEDHIWVAGNTWSGDFPVTKGSYCDGINLNTGPYNIDMYVVKMTPEGDKVEYGTFIGGTTAEEPYDIKVHEGVVAVGGMTISADFPTTMGPHNSNFGAAVIMTFDEKLSAMESSWVWDGIASESVRSVAFDRDDKIVLAGWTGSPGFPTTPGAFQRMKPASQSGFIARFSPEDNLPEFCTFLGGGAGSFPMSLALDSDMNIYTGGYTMGYTGFGHPLTEGAFDMEYDDDPYSGVEGFVTKMDPNGTKLIYSTLVGGDGREFINDIALEGDGNVVGVLTAQAAGNLTLTPDAHDTTFGGETEGYVFHLNSDGTDLLYSSFHGGSYEEELMGVCVDAVDNFVVVGFTDSADMPVTQDGFQTRFGSYGDMLVTVIGEYTPTSAPLSLVANGNEGYIELSWLPPDDEGGYPVREYHVYRGDGADDLRLYVIQDSSTTFTDEDVEWGRFYHYAIMANNWKGMSPRSNVASARSVTVPDAPVNLTAHAGVGTVALSWGPPEFTGGLPLTGFNVYRTSEDGQRELVSTTGPVVNNLVDEGAEDGTNYTYSLAALNEHGESRAWANVTLMTTAAPTQPRELEHSYGSMFVLLEWRRPSQDFGLPLTGYRVYRLEGEDPAQLIGMLDPSVREFNDTEVMLGTPYRYYVTALNARGEGPPSLVIDAMVMVPPGPPTGVSAVAEEHFVRVTWVPPVFDGASPLTGFRVYLVYGDGTAECIGGQNVGGLGDVQMAFLHDVPYDGVVHRYLVTAVNGEGESLPSEPAETTVYSLPAAPSGLEIEWGDGWLALLWQPPASDGGTGVRTFTVYRRAPGEDAMTPLVTLPYGTLTLEDGEVENGAEYEYRVTCTNMIGEGPASPTVSAVPAGLPDAPGGVSAEGHNASVRVTWSPPGWDGGRAVTGYRVYLVANDSAPSMLVQLEAGETEFVHDGLMNGRVYVYAVRALTIVGASEMSGMVDARPVGPPSTLVDISAFWAEDHVLLTWDRPFDDGGSPVMGYMLYREGQDGGDPVQVADPTWSDFEVEAGTSYNYTIYAYNAVGDGPSARVTVHVPAEEPPPVEPETVEWSYLALLAVLVALTVALVYMGLRRRTAGPGDGGD